MNNLWLFYSIIANSEKINCWNVHHNMQNISFRMTDFQTVALGLAIWQKIKYWNAFWFVISIINQEKKTDQNKTTHFTVFFRI